MIGSVVNALSTAPGQPEPKVGDGATVCMWSDRNPATITEVLRFKSGEREGQIRGVVVKADNWKVVSGSEHDGSAQYEYQSNDAARGVTFLVNQRGQYVQKGGGDKLRIGHRERYYDPSF